MEKKINKISDTRFYYLSNKMSFSVNLSLNLRPFELQFTISKMLLPPSKVKESYIPVGSKIKSLKGIPVWSNIESLKAHQYGQIWSL